MGKRSATAWLSESASKGSPKRVQTAAVSERVESTSIDDETAEVVMDEVVGTNDESLAGPERENRGRAHMHTYLVGVQCVLYCIYLCLCEHVFLYSMR